MDKILDMMMTWPPLGQGFFLFMMALMLIATFNHLVRMGVILFRGWPPCEEEDKQAKKLEG